MHYKIKLSALLAASLFIMAGCNNGSIANIKGEDKNANKPLTETYWKLTELMGKPITATQNEPHLILKAKMINPAISSNEKNGRVIGSGGCNRISGNYTLDKLDRIHFSQMVSTMMACASGMTVEREFLTVLGKVDSYMIHGDQLQLNKARMAPLAKFVAGTPK